MRNAISKSLKLSCLSVILGFLFCGCLFCGCSFFGMGGQGNGYVEFFRPAIPKEKVERLLASGNYPNEIKVMKVMNMNEAFSMVDSLNNEYGCIFIVASEFEGALHEDNNPTEVARRSGANVYINLVEYSRTASGTYTTMMPTTSSTTTNSNASAFGSGGWASGSGSSTSMTYSSVPITRSYSVDRYEQGAMFYLCD